MIDNLPLFSAALLAAPKAPKGPSKLEERLAALHPDEMTPRDALAAIYDLRSLLGD